MIKEIVIGSDKKLQTSQTDARGGHGGGRCGRRCWRNCWRNCCGRR